MPTYNRFDIVQETIQKTIAIKSSIGFELIVVNDGEPLPFSISHPKLTILKNPKKGAAAARNFGAAHAQYPLLFFIDDDMWITAESLIAIDNLNNNLFFENSCTVLNWRYPDVLIQRMKLEKIGRYLLQANYHTMEGRTWIEFDHNMQLMPTTSIGSGSFVINNMLFNSVGGYEDKFIFQGEDIELSQKLNQNKVTILIYVPITCYHNQEDRLEIDGFIDRIYRGYLSQAKAGMLNKLSLRQQFVALFIPFFSVLKFIYTTIPNRPFFDKVSFRCIGLLSSITSIKAINVVKRNKLK
jgi:glycosyltransferase involved in cell wall biosynthesis